MIPKTTANDGHPRLAFLEGKFLEQIFILQQLNAISERSGSLSLAIVEGYWAE